MIPSLQPLLSSHTHIAPTTFGRLAVQDPRLIGDMRRGRRLGAGTVERVERFMAEYRA